MTDIEADTPTDAALDALLRSELAPPSREPDPVFAAQVSAAVAEAERYRRWRVRFRRQLTTDLLTLIGIGGALPMLSQVPAVGATLTQAPAYAWPIMLLFLAWLALNRGAVGARRSLS